LVQSRSLYASWMYYVQLMTFDEIDIRIVTKYHYLRWQWIFFFLPCFCCLSLISENTFTELDNAYE